VGRGIDRARRARHPAATDRYAGGGRRAWSAFSPGPTPPTITGKVLQVDGGQIIAA
jgi:hypothetical protein